MTPATDIRHRTLSDEELHRLSELRQRKMEVIRQIRELLGISQERDTAARSYPSVIQRETPDRPWNECLRCGYSWQSMWIGKIPRHCARCHTASWNTPPVNMARARTPEDPPNPNWKRLKGRAGNQYTRQDRPRKARTTAPVPFVPKQLMVPKLAPPPGLNTPPPGARLGGPPPVRMDLGPVFVRDYYEPQPERTFKPPVPVITVDPALDSLEEEWLDGR